MDGGFSYSTFEPKGFFWFPILVLWLEIQTGPLNLSNRVSKVLLFVLIDEQKRLRFNMNT
ncbi:hypothetical protein DJ94_4159 [Bacillus pseudomycoides]|nr:hypothetical protein DJ94_4159 [Bacillus pseudomycoides]